ncbi:4Fe-4S binding protein [candidate division WOR-3 bacterium]|nr:4Fe-4S binding protein [candidate division WOR-3 bacterium]
MKYLKTHPDKCIGCMVCMDVCSETFFGEKDHRKSSIKITPKKEEGFEITVCNQKCRLCVDECPVKALSITSQGVVILNKKLCVGCLACVAVCPINAMMWLEGLENPFKCVACGKCAEKCPSGAIEIAEEE